MQLFKTKTHEKTILLNQLSQFGLSPNEWDLEVKNSQQHIVRHKIENDFYFIGEIEKDKEASVPRWRSLCLASL